jgi:exopolysaccharide production protein ExoY
MDTSTSSRSVIALIPDDRVYPLGGRVKRIVDVCLAFSAIIILSPLLLLCSLSIMMITRDKVFFRHRRVGFQGQLFECLKFQTMVPNGDKVLRKYLDENPIARLEWETTRKLRDDPRVTPFGRILRKTSVDELPQLFNVLKGDMSIVGPRPVVEQELLRYKRRRDVYMMCRPGISGMWQVSGRSQTTYRKRVACDAYYSNNWSLWLDVKIIARTLPVLLGSDKAY